MKPTTPAFSPKAFVLMFVGALVLATGAAFWSGIFSKDLGSDSSTKLLPKGVKAANLDEVRLVVEKTLKKETKDLAVLLDVRPKKVHLAGHIPGSLSLPVEELTKAMEELGLNQKTPYILYCDGGDCNASISAAKALHAFGFKNLKVFEGGYEAWQNRSNP